MFCFLTLILFSIYFLIQQNLPKEMLKNIKNYLSENTDFEKISVERRAILTPLTDWIRQKKAKKEPIFLTFICTHNSRRSHFGQFWAAAAADFYQIKNVICFSGGTETTACNPRTLSALARAGVNILATNAAVENPVWLLQFSEKQYPVAAFSKVFDQSPNPKMGFAAIMTCSSAEQNCPFVPGAEKRFSIKYNDPKIADDQPNETEIYDERCREICREMLFVFAKI
jgi:arsenate reductase (thioredoxin)